MALSKSLVYVGIKGCVVALDKTTGTEVWRTKLKRGEFVNLTTDGDRIYATTVGEVFCLEPSAGSVLWSNPMRGLGMGLATLLGGMGDGNSAVIAEAARKAQQARQAAAGA